jgi:hypothetical protein
MTTVLVILLCWIGLGLCVAWVIGGAANLIGCRPGE